MKTPHFISTQTGKILVAGWLLLAAPFMLAAQWVAENVPNPRATDLRIHTVDPDNLLDDASQAQIDQLLTTVEQNTTAEIMVVALKSVGQVFIKDFATQLFNYWKIGNADKDNGLLILMVDDQYKVSFETGYGMEGIFPDAICMRIIHNQITPFMREGKYGEGILSGVQEVVRLLNDPAAVEEIKADMAAAETARREASLQKLRTAFIGYLLVSLLVVILCVLAVRRKRISVRGVSPSVTEPYDSYKRLVSSRSGYIVLTILFPITMVIFWLWYNLLLRRLRRMPRACSNCNHPMTLLSEKQEDAYLNVGQQSEEMVGSVDYDAWICQECGKREFLPYSKSFTRYKPCPVCGYKTYAQTGERIVQLPTPLTTGEGERIYRCAHCNHELRKRFVIPMVIVAAAGRGGRGGGGFGGGGFGGGSFGGGMSGGGGATGGWR